MLRASLLHVLAAAVLGTVALAQERKPPVPPGRDPGGVAVALISIGIDYTSPSLAPRLARDGEGELIGWDLEDNDRRPFDKTKGNAADERSADGTGMATFMLDAGGIRLVPVRINPADPATLARALAFVAQTPARVAVVAIWSSGPEAREPLRQAAVRFKDVLLILPAIAPASAGEASHPALHGLENVLAAEPGTASAVAVVSAGRVRHLSGEGLAAAAAGRAAAAFLKREPQLDAAALKRRLIAAGGDDLWRARK